jgi:vacuolar-type H+-ATPase subunit H
VSSSQEGLSMNGQQGQQGQQGQGYQGGAPYAPTQIASPQQYQAAQQASAPPRAAAGGGRDLFVAAGGVPANLLVVAGLLMVLLGAMLPDCRSASARKTIAEFREAEAMVDLEVDEFRAQQERQVQAALANPQAPVPSTTQNEAALQQRRDALESQYRIAQRRRDAIGAEASVQGMRAHLFVNWIGRFLLLLGLLMMTLRAEGTKQKVLVAVLLLAMLSALPGLQIDLSAGSRLGSRDTSTLSLPGSEVSHTER